MANSSFSNSLCLCIYMVDVRESFIYLNLLLFLNKKGIGLIKMIKHAMHIMDSSEPRKIIIDCKISPISYNNPYLYSTNRLPTHSIMLQSFTKLLMDGIYNREKMRHRDIFIGISNTIKSSIRNNSNMGGG